MGTGSLILRNFFRHPLRNMLTALGIAVALLAFSLIRTMIDSWYSGVRASAKDRLITRNAVSLIFHLPLAYTQRIAQVDGVSNVAYGNWFGGKFGEERYFFQLFAVSPSYLDIYSNYQLPDADRQAYIADRRGVLVGRDVAERFGLKVGQVLQLRGSVYPGLWEFTIRGIFDRSGDDTRNMFFHWEYLNERVRQDGNTPPDEVGFYVIQLASGRNPAAVSQAVDEVFKNSSAETLTETETAFLRSFVTMSSAIISALDVISFVVVFIMLLVLTNTMLMSARERYREYSILKALGFGRSKIFSLVVGESLLLTLIGVALLLLVLVPVFSLPPRQVLGPLNDFFPVFELRGETIGLVAALALTVALVSGVIPALSLMRMNISEALRRPT